MVLLFFFAVMADAAEIEPRPTAWCDSVRRDSAGLDRETDGRIESERGTPQLNLVYLVPADRTVRADYIVALQKAARGIRSWYWREVNQGKTFRFSTPTVHVVALPHDADYYKNNPAGDRFVQFWNNVLEDAFALTGGSFNDPLNVWAYYIDADPACGQCGGCGTSGVLLVSANDLRGLAEEPRIAPCPDEEPDTGPVGRWIGGLGHELGHAFGLPHPPGCDEGAPSCDYSALMWNGFRQYPNTYLREDEKAFLSESPFFIPALPRLRSTSRP
ncbi:MAG: hypothetical protein KY432_08780 [Acidobacteria bacterium]|nr:hypothetical protein [Acidobacteriota bacterium]